MANSLEVGDPGGQRGFIDLLAVTAPPGMTAMLLDHQWHVGDVDLLDHPGHDRRRGLQVMPASGAKIEAMVERTAVDQFGREVSTFVLGVTRLPADAASVLARRRRRLGRLDDVRRRRLGGGRGILPRRGELLLQLGDRGAEGRQLPLQGIQLGAQPPTTWASGLDLGSHGLRDYARRLKDTTPVNGYQLAERAWRGDPTALETVLLEAQRHHY